MARIPTIDKKESLPPERQPLYDAIAKSRGRVGGPFLALLNSPEIAERTFHLGTYIRFESQLNPKVVEVAALTTARELECKHEWAAHVAHARKSGIPQETIRLIHQRKGTESFSSEDAAVVSYVRELLSLHRVSEPTFQALFARLDVKGLVELTATIGYYAMLACALNAFDVVSEETSEDLRI